METRSVLCKCGRPGKRVITFWVSHSSTDGLGEGYISSGDSCCHSWLCLVKASIRALIFVLKDETGRVHRFGKLDDAIITEPVPDPEPIPF